MAQSELTSRDVRKLSDTRELMEREWAPCRYNCPVHADVRAYVELAARGHFREAIDVIRERLPFASVCGRICHHPCEANCRRDGVDEAVAIREIKRFVAETQGAEGATVLKVPQDKARVAIVGAGPAGMAAALELARLGYRPTVFEKFPVAGGIPATAIPKYRLPADVIQQDVDWICAHGVEVVTGVEIGSDRTIEDLLDDDFEAVLIATGLAKSRSLPMPGADHERVYPVLEYLTAARFDRPMPVGDDVLVIGGGNVAMDAARTAVRQGAGRVRAMCLEDPDEMPAWSWEQEEAIEEGVSFIHRRGPTEVLIGDDGAVTGVRTRKVTRVFDDEGRFAPEYDDGDVSDVECDTVILAIGQTADPGFLKGSGLDTDDRGRMKYDPHTQRTSRENVFACGEIVTAPGSAVEACASGQRAARAMHMHLSGQTVELDDELPPVIDEIAEETAGKVLKTERNAVTMRPAAERRTDSEPIDETYSVEAALREARRCMSCGGGAEVLVDKCAACLTCLRVCPFDVPQVTDVARISSTLCQSCGMCIVECPTNAIVARSWDVRGLDRETAKAIRGDGRKIAAYVCGHHAPAAAWSGEASDRVPGVAELYLPSMSRLGVQHILHALESGAEGVIVVACDIGADRYPNATERVRKRVAQARELIEEIGLPGDKVQLVETASEGRAAMRESMTTAADAIHAAGKE